MTGRSGDDQDRENPPGPDEDELFAAVAAAMSRPPLRESETFMHEREADDGAEARDDETPEEPEAPEDPAAAAVVDTTDEPESDDVEPDDDASSDDATSHVYAPPPAESTSELPVQRAERAYDELFYGGTSDASSGGGDDGWASDDDEDDGTGPRWGRRGLVAGLLVLAAAYVAGYYLTGTRMPANASVAGVDVSGQSPTQARALLTRELEDRSTRSITLVSGDSEFKIEPEKAGMSVDIDQSVAAAGGESSWHPGDMIGLFFGEHEHDAVVRTERSKFQGVLGTVAEAVDQEVVEPQITFPNAKATPRAPKDGRVLDRAATGDRLKQALVGDGKPVEAVLKDVQPTVDQQGLDEAMSTIGKTAVSGPVTLKVGDTTQALPVTAYAPALVVRVQDGALEPYIDPKKLAGPLTNATTGIGEKAVDATVEIRNDKPVVVEGKKGVGLQPDEMSTKLLPAIAATGADRSVSITAKAVDPAFTTEDAKKLKITEKISEFETQFPYAVYRNVNQGRAAELINGTIIKPGETFSFNTIVGERTEANGFVTGTVINGGVFREELGGGVSQVATTTYNAGFFGGMDDVEHHPHAFYIDRYPVGREATVYFGSLDLRWRNPTKYGVLVRAYVVPSTPSSAGRMHVELWSTKVWDEVRASESARRNYRAPGTRYDDTNRCVPQSPVQGFDIDIIRTFVKDGKTAKTEKDTAVYQAADRVVCGPRPGSDDD